VNLDDLREGLDSLAGPSGRASVETVAALRRRAGRARAWRRAAAVGTIAVVGVLIVGVVAVAREGSGTVRVDTPASEPTTATPVLDHPLVTVVGDSVMVGAPQAMVREIQSALAPSAPNNVTEERRLPNDVPALLDQQREEGHLGELVILHVGTNGTMTADQFARIMQRLSGASLVLVVNDKVPRPWEAPNNAVLAAEVPKYGNAVLVDWHAFGTAHPELFYDDGIHLRPDGAQAYAAFILSRVTSRPEPTTSTVDATSAVPDCRSGRVPCDPGDGELQLSEKVVVAEGDDESAGHWQLEAYQSSSGYCADLRIGAGAAGGCFTVPLATTVSPGTSGASGASSWSHGPVRRDVAVVRLELSDGQVLDVAPVGQASGFPVNFYVARVPAGAQVVVVRALDANGAEIRT
jgi:hypothetical protein